MELVNKHAHTPAQSWTSRAERRHPPKVDYYSELRSWVQHAMFEAEKNKGRAHGSILASVHEE